MFRQSPMLSTMFLHEMYSRLDLGARPTGNSLPCDLVYFATSQRFLTYSVYSKIVYMLMHIPSDGRCHIDSAVCKLKIWN